MKKLHHLFYCLLPLFLMNPVQAKTNTIKIGQHAPDFRISSIDKDYFSLAEMRSDGHVLLYFWSSRCHVCHSLQTQINALHVRYKNRHVTVAGINIGLEKRSEVKRYLKDNFFNFLVLNDDAQKNDLRQKYQIVSTPTFVLVSPAGKILYISHTIPNMEDFIEPLDP